MTGRQMHMYRWEAVSGRDKMSKVLLKNLQTGKEYLLEGDVSIGRHTGNDIVIPDHTVSGTHAKITNVGSSWYISDCNSRNGVEINGFRVPTEGKLGLRNGCTLKLGDSFLSFTADENTIADYLSRSGDNKPKIQRDEPKTQTTAHPIQPIIQGNAGSNGETSSRRTENHKKPNGGLVVALCSAGAVIILLVFGWCFLNHSNGNKRLSEGHYTQALNAYRKDFLFSRTQRIQAAMLAGEEAYSKKNFDVAATYFWYAGEEGRDRWADSVYESAVQKIHDGEPEEAISLLNTISDETRAQEQIGVAQLAIAQNQFETGNWEQAVLTAQAINNTTYADVNTFCDKVYHSVGKQFFDRGEYEEARDSYTKCVQDETAETNKIILKVLLEQEYEDAAVLADRSIRNEKTDIPRTEWGEAFSSVIGSSDPYLAKLGNALGKGEDIPTFFATVHHKVAEERFLAGNYTGAKDAYETCKNDEAAAINAHILKLLEDKEYVEAATLANSAIEEELTDLSRKQWQTCVNKYVGDIPSTSDIDKRLFSEAALAIIADTTFDSSEETISSFKNNAPRGSMIGSYTSKSNNMWLVSSLDDLYGDCGSESAGKILIVAKKRNYPDKAVSQAILLDMMRLLPGKYYPASFAEVQYIVLIIYDYNQDGHYTHTTVSLRENARVEIIRMPDRYKPYTSGTEYGGVSPESFMYSGSPPAWKSGDAPNMGAAIHKALTTIIK